MCRIFAWCTCSIQCWRGAYVRRGTAAAQITAVYECMLPRQPLRVRTGRRPRGEQDDHGRAADQGADRTGRSRHRCSGRGNQSSACRLTVNYDLPWNPNRLEQRFGRIHRIGQTEVCHLWNLVADETREGEVYRKLLEKLEEARKALGGQVFDVLGKLQFQGRALRRSTIEARLSASDLFNPGANGDGVGDETPSPLAPG